MPQAKQPPKATLLVSKIRKSARVIETETRIIYHERRPRGAYDKLRTALLGLRGGSVVVPFRGEADAARELLGALCRSLTLKEGARFGMMRATGEKAFYVSRIKENSK